MNKQYATINDLQLLCTELINKGHGGVMVTINNKYTISVDTCTGDVQYNIKESLEEVPYVDIQTW